MQKNKFEYHHGDLRNALVESATHLIASTASDAFSLREAARAVGVSANAAYRHFEDKASLLTAVAQRGFAVLAEAMQVAMSRAKANKKESSVAVHRFHAMGRAYVHFALENPELFRVMFGPNGLSCLPKASASETLSQTLTPYQLLGRVLDALVDDEVISLNRRRGAELNAWVVVHGFAALALDRPESLATGPERARALESALDFALSGLRATERFD